MILWIDAQLSPAIAGWITETFGVPTVALHDLRLRDATDHQIFMAARQAQAVVITKDSDFVQLLERYGTLPQIILYGSLVATRPMRTLSVSFWAHYPKQ